MSQKFRHLIVRKISFSEVRAIQRASLGYIPAIKVFLTLTYVILCLNVELRLCNFNKFSRCGLYVMILIPWFYDTMSTLLIY